MKRLPAFFPFFLLLATNSFCQLNGEWLDTSFAESRKDPYDANTVCRIYRFTKLEIFDSLFHCSMSTNRDTIKNSFKGTIRINRDTLFFSPPKTSYYEQFRYKLQNGQLELYDYYCKSKVDSLSLGVAFSCFGYLFLTAKPEYVFKRPKELLNSHEE